MMIQKNKAEERLKKKIEKEKERLVNILAGKTKCCPECGSFKIEEIWMGNPINYGEPRRSYQMKNIKCTDCGAGHVMLDKIDLLNTK